MSDLVRTQLSITRGQRQRLRDAAARAGVSVSELVRQAIDVFLADRRSDDLWERAFEVVGAFRGDACDVAARHDDYLARARSR